MSEQRLKFNWGDQHNLLEKCVSLGSPEKQNQQGRWINTEIER